MKKILLFLTIFGLFTFFGVFNKKVNAQQGETWVIDEVPDIDVSIWISNINFTTAETLSTIIDITSVGIYYQGGPITFAVYKTNTGWALNALRTITFETAPTGELLTWLEANAVKQTGGGGSYDETDLDNAYDDGYDDGYDVGLVDGYDDGYDVGLVDGYDDGYDVGLDDGYDNGYAVGLDDGLQTTTIFNNIIEWETYISILDGVGDPFELQVAKIEMGGVGNGFTELSHSNLKTFYNWGMPDYIFQMYLLDDTYNHYFINSLDYRSWQDQLYLPLGNYQMLSLTGAPNVKMSLFSSIWGGSLDNDIDAFLGGYPNDSGDWFLVRNLKTIDQYSYDYGYDKGYDNGVDDGIPIGKQQGFDLGYDKGLQDGLDDDAYERGIQDAQNTALGSIDKWIVPAMIVVIILGGFVTIIQRKKDGGN